MSVFQAGDGNKPQDGVANSGKEYRQGQYIFQNKKDPMADYQNTPASFMNGANKEMFQSKVKDKKLVFIEPQSQIEQEEWLDKLIAEITGLHKKEYADLLSTEIEYLLNLLIPQLEQEPIIIEVEAPVVIAGDTHG